MLTEPQISTGAASIDECKHLVSYSYHGDVTGYRGKATRIPPTRHPYESKFPLPTSDSGYYFSQFCVPSTRASSSSSNIVDSSVKGIGVVPTASLLSSTTEDGLYSELLISDPGLRVNHSGSDHVGPVEDAIRLRTAGGQSQTPDILFPPPSHRLPQPMGPGRDMSQSEGVFPKGAIPAGTAQDRTLPQVSPAPLAFHHRRIQERRWLQDIILFLRLLLPIPTAGLRLSPFTLGLQGEEGANT